MKEEVRTLEEANYDLEEELEQEKEMRRDIQKKMATGMSAAMKRGGTASGGGSMRRTTMGGGGGGWPSGRRRQLGSAIVGATIDVKKAAADVEQLLSALVAAKKIDFEDWRAMLLGNLATLARQFDDYCGCAERFSAATAAFTGAIQTFNATTSEAASYNMIETSMQLALK
eukprot:SAG31_NODE_7771_length_1600_cov_1.527648_2_plen_171_part_00